VPVPSWRYLSEHCLPSLGTVASKRLDGFPAASDAGKAARMRPIGRNTTMMTTRRKPSPKAGPDRSASGEDWQLRDARRRPDKRTVRQLRRNEPWPAEPAAAVLRRDRMAETAASTPGGDPPAAEADDEPWDADGAEPVTAAPEEVTASESQRARNPNAARARGPVAEAT